MGRRRTGMTFFQKESYTWLTGTWKGDQHDQSSGKWKSKPQLKYHLTPVRMAINKWQENKCASVGCRKKRTVVQCGGNVNWLEPLWKTLLRSFKNLKQSYHMIQWSNFWVYTQRKWNRDLEEIFVLSLSLQRYSQWPKYENSLSVYTWMNGQKRCDYHIYRICIYNIIPPGERRKPCPSGNMNGAWGHYAKWNKSAHERHVLCDITYMHNLKKSKTH